MSPATQLSILAFAAGALAVGHNHGHDYLHHYTGHRVGASPSGDASWSGSGVPFPYPNANSTGMYGTTGTGYATGATTQTVTSVEIATVIVSPLPYSSSSGSAASESTATCTTDVTVTTTQRTYITVTATSSASISPVSSSTNSSSTSQSTATVESTVYNTPSSSQASPVQSSSSSAVASSSSSYAAWSSSSAPAISPSNILDKVNAWAPSAYSSAVQASAAAWTSSAAAPSSYVASSTSSTAAAASSTASSSGSSGKKRGIAYNDASLASAMVNSNMGLAFNWGSSAGGFSSEGISYIPLLWGTASDFTSSWSSNAQAAIDAGSTVLFSFNEPDIASQANMSPQEAAAAYMQYMEPFAGKAKLCSPAVTNSQTSGQGLSWLTEFMSACSGCTIDCINLHWYDHVSDSQNLKDHITQGSEIGGGKPVYLSEFGAIDGTDSDKCSFLEDVMPWMGNFLSSIESWSIANKLHRFLRSCQRLLLLHGLRRSPAERYLAIHLRLDLHELQLDNFNFLHIPRCLGARAVILLVYASVTESSGTIRCVGDATGSVPAFARVARHFFFSLRSHDPDLIIDLTRTPVLESCATTICICVRSTVPSRFLTEVPPLAAGEILNRSQLDDPSRPRQLELRLFRKAMYPIPTFSISEDSTRSKCERASGSCAAFLSGKPTCLHFEVQAAMRLAPTICFTIALLSTKPEPRLS